MKSKATNAAIRCVAFELGQMGQSEISQRLRQDQLSIKLFKGSNPKVASSDMLGRLA